MNAEVWHMIHAAHRGRWRAVVTTAQEVITGRITGITDDDFTIGELFTVPFVDVESVAPDQEAA